jgi:hypothetical protein
MMDNFDEEVEHLQRVQKHNASLLNKEFVYTRASETDIRKTFARFGFVPPSVDKDKINE